MTIFDAVILGAIEGFTEFLPISSTGHLILASTALGIPDSAFLKSFTIAVQLGAILAVVSMYWRSFLVIEMLKRLAVAFLPTALIGLALYSFIKSHLLGNEVVVLWALLLGGIALIAFERMHKEKADAASSPLDITYAQSALIGVFQSIAIIPGVSRSAATIIGGLLLGIRRVAIVEFSFLLAVPTMGAATGLDILKNPGLFTSDTLPILAAGFAVAFVVAMLAIKFLIAFVRSRSFVPFGVYRIVIALLFFLFVL